jgi:pimeloyl-ACP methyl ester carboxylesterase
MHARLCLFTLTSLAFVLSSPTLLADSACICRDGLLRLPDGRQLSYREYGNPEGPLVFYFHGTPGSRKEAALIAEDACQADVHLVSIDRPGLGRSTDYCARRILDWPSDVAALADSLGAPGQSFGVIGMSGGAPFALACALLMPERMSHVAIVSGHAPMGAPGVQPGSQDKQIALVTRRPRLAKLGFGLISRKLDRRPDKVVQKVTKEWTAADRQLILCNPTYYRQLIENLDEAARCGVDGLVRDVRLLGCDWGFCLNQIASVEVSIWQGACDRVSTPSMGHYFNRQIAGSELMIDPRAGHVTMLKWHAAEIFAKFQ